MGYTFTARDTRTGGWFGVYATADDAQARCDEMNAATAAPPARETDQAIDRASHIVSHLRIKALGIATAALLALTLTSIPADAARHYPDVPTPLSIVGTTNPAG